MNGARVLRSLGVMAVWAAARLFAAGEAVGAEITDFAGRPFVPVLEKETDFGPAACRFVRIPAARVSAHEANNTIPVEFFFPSRRAAPRPPGAAVVILHGLNSLSVMERHIALTLARRGVAAAWFALPYQEARQSPEQGGFPPGAPADFVASLEQWIDDLRRVVDFMAAQPEVDPDRIGLLGVSLGAVLGTAAAAEEPRLERIALFLPGANLEKIFTRKMLRVLERLPPDDKAEYDRVLARIEPMARAERLAELAAAGRALFIIAEEDDIIPPERAADLLAAAGVAPDDPTVMRLPGLNHLRALMRIDLPLPRLWSFFGAAESDPAAGDAPDPWGRIGAAWRSLASELVDGTAEGKMLAVDIALRDGSALAARRGPGRRMRIEASRPDGPSVVLVLSGDGVWGRIGNSVLMRIQPADGGDGDAWAEIWRSPLGQWLLTPLMPVARWVETPELPALLGQLETGGDGRFHYRLTAGDAALLSLRLSRDGRLAEFDISESAPPPLGGFRARVGEVPLDEAAFAPPASDATITADAALVMKAAELMIANFSGHLAGW